MIGVIGGVVFEEAEGDFEELVEDGAEHGHFAFAGLGEAIGEGLEARVVAAGDQGGHEEDFAQVAIALGADGGRCAGGWCRSAGGAG